MLINRVAVAMLPSSVPRFLETPESIEEIAFLGPEADRTRGNARTYYDDNLPAHFVDIDDDGTVAGVVRLDALPKDRQAYDTRLREAGANEYTRGFLPYALIDGFEILRVDFAYWRAAAFAVRASTNTADNAFFEKMRALREALIRRDIGYWGHYVADGSQPLHVTVHYDGWEERYPGSKGIHARFEIDYVGQYVDEAMIKSRVEPFSACNCTIQKAVGDYLTASAAQVVPLYELFKSGAFATRTSVGVSFTAGRVAFGASELRNLIAEAWLASRDQTISYPKVNVRDIESGKVPLTRKLFTSG